MAADPVGVRNPRVVAARKLLRRVVRRRTGRFLVEGAQAVREAVAGAHVRELFVTPDALERCSDVVAAVRRAQVRVTVVDDRAAASLSETVTPQGIVAVCDLIDVPVDVALGGRSGAPPRLAAVLVDVADPGNAGTVIRVADAAGADAVVLAGDAVDPHNGKAVRASTGSLFHLPIAQHRDVTAVLAACRRAGLTLLVADSRGELDIHDTAATAVLAGPSAWFFGGEAHGVPADVAAQVDHRIRVPIYGRAESLNLATAAAVCLYASAAAQHCRAPSDGSEGTASAMQPGP